MRPPVTAGRVDDLPARDAAEEGEEGVDLDHVVGLGNCDSDSNDSDQSDSNDSDQIDSNDSDQSDNNESDSSGSGPRGGPGELWQ